MEKFNDYNKALESINNKIESLLINKNKVILGIDGMAASGKTTLAKEIADYFSGEVIHLDDFFLQDYQRIEKRMSEVGGNLDYERFMIEVVKPIKNENSFVYSKYNCQTKEMIKEYMNMESKVIVIEGAYSLRHKFQEIYDLKVLMLIDSGLQKKRINQRNEKMYDKFINEWIPKENSYLKHFEIQTNCDFTIKI